MRKILALLLSVVIIFAPVYSYAVLPIIATAASAAGRILLGNAVKKPTATAMRRGFIPCIGSIQAAIGCASLGLGIADLLRDKGYTVEDNSTTNNIEINIYKMASCSPELSFNWTRSGSSGLSALDYQTWSIDEYNSRSDGINGGGHNRYYLTPQSGQPFQNAIAYLNQQVSLGQLPMVSDWTYFYNFTWYPAYQYMDNPPKTTSKVAYAFYKCSNFDNRKIYISQNELNTIIDQSINNLTIDERKQLYKNIYNYDYSQHPSITINNNTTSGNTINNDIKNAPKEFEVSVELGDKINNGQQDMDDINDNNCSKDTSGAYDKCGDDKDEPTPDPDPDPTPDPDPDPDTGTDEPEDPKDPQCPADYIYNPVVQVCELVPADEEQPQICSTNELTQKFCDWIDWTKKKPDIPVNTQVEVIDKSKDIELDKNRYDFSATCPPDYDIPINTGFGNSTVTLKYSSMCVFLAKMAPFNEGAAYIYAAFIITGIKSRNGDNG